MSIVSKWDALKKTLESLPAKKASLRKMDLSKLPRQVVQVESEAEVGVEEDIRQIRGVFLEGVIEEGDIEREMGVGMDVCVYTRMKRKRPWVGRVTDVKDRETFVMNWYEKDTASKCGKFIAMQNDDGTLYVTDLDVTSVMFWSFTENREEASFVITPYWLDCLKREYSRMDQDG